jgi:hypothetical protein
VTSLALEALIIVSNLFLLCARMIKPMPVDEAYYDTKNQVIKAERRMLKELGFCIHVKHPHKVRSSLLFWFCLDLYANCLRLLSLDYIHLSESHGVG